MQPTSRVMPFSAVAAVSVAAAVLLSSCASTRMDAQWTNPEYQGRNVRGAPVSGGL